MALTLQQTKRLFQGYPNYDLKVADAVAEKIYNAGSDEDVQNRIPFAGSTSKYVTGGIRFKTGGAVDFYNNSNVLMSGLTWNTNVLYLISQAASQSLNVSGWTTLTLSGDTMNVSKVGGSLGFFGTAAVVKQTIDPQATETPTDLATCISAITKANIVINSLRSKIQTTGFMA